MIYQRADASGADTDVHAVFGDDHSLDQQLNDALLFAGKQLVPHLVDVGKSIADVEFLNRPLA